MTDSNQEIKDQILLAVLEDVPFDGWQWDVVQQATQKAGLDPMMADAVFPEKIDSILNYFSEWADRAMMTQLEALNPEDLKIRDRVQKGVEARLDVLSDHKESVRAASAYWAHPLRKKSAAKQVWKTADHIWQWAGDTATDYNHYTKRFLLSGVITTTFLFWLQDKSDDHAKTIAFLERRISNVLTVGKAMSGIKKFLPDIPFKKAT